MQLVEEITTIVESRIKLSQLIKKPLPDAYAEGPQGRGPN
jgi:hypothetical protein